MFIYHRRRLRTLFITISSWGFEKSTSPWSKNHEIRIFFDNIFVGVLLNWYIFKTYLSLSAGFSNMVCEIYSGTRNITNLTESVKNGLPHVCLNMLCFCILKRIGIATLFSQLWKLNNFAKKIIKKCWKFLEFREKIQSLKFLKISKISKIFFVNFPRSWNFDFFWMIQKITPLKSSWLEPLWQ